MNAPMAGFAGGALASAVTLAGALGLIGDASSVDDVRKELRIASEAMVTDSTLSSLEILLVGVEFLPFVVKLEDAVPVVEEYKPAVLWLFAAKELDDYATWATALRQHCMLRKQRSRTRYAFKVRMRAATGLRKVPASSRWYQKCRTRLCVKDSRISPLSHRAVSSMGEALQPRLLWVLRAW
jgi:hypothetical protein